MAEFGAGQREQAQTRGGLAQQAAVEPGGVLPDPVRAQRVRQPVEFLAGGQRLLECRLLPFPPLALGVTFGDLLRRQLREAQYGAVAEPDYRLSVRVLLAPLPIPLLELVGLAAPRVVIPVALRRRPRRSRDIHSQAQSFKRCSHALLPRLDANPRPQLATLPIPVLGARHRSQLSHHVGISLELRKIIQLGKRQLGERIRPGTHLGGNARDPQPATHERLATPRLRRQLTHTGTKVQQSLIPVSLLQRRQIGTLAILHQHQLTLGFHVHFAHNARHPLNASQLAGRQTTMTDHHTKHALAVFLVVGGDHERLLQPLFLDAVGQLGDVAHVFAGVVRVRDEVLYVDIDDVDSH